MDLNGDGKQDLISGSWPGEIYFFEQKGKGQYKKSPLKGADGNNINCGRATAVAAADWDSDGDQDLIVGNIEGAVQLVRNQGTRYEPKFARPVAVTAEDSPIKQESGDTGPCVADWDKDGKQDLLVGSGQGDVFWYRNTGSNTQPVLAEAIPLLGPPHQRYHKDANQIGGRTKVCVHDWNEDGKPDLLVGDCNWEQKDDNTHGFVWLMLRKQILGSEPEKPPKQT